jgi:uncharacterized protein YebE (UPF0316 family)
MEVALYSLMIVAARIADVSLGTLRTVAVIHGRRTMAWMLGFIEVLIWVLVVSQVITSVSENHWYAIAYAFGFATGNFVGITIEQYFAYGHQVIRVFTRNGSAMAEKLRAEGFRVTLFRGEGRDGHVEMLFIETRRRTAIEITEIARQIDRDCYYVVDDIRAASVSRAPRSVQTPSAATSVRK